MLEPIEDAYFNWLYSKVAVVQNPTPSLTFWTLFRDLHSIEFVWLISGDDNRAQDGLDLRREFLRGARLDQDPAWMNIGCSVLEMLISFANRVQFERDDITEREWFWIFLTNLGLNELTDAKRLVSRRVAEVIDVFLWRTYDVNGGNGGMFPLAYPQRDQREVELWYQFCEYLVDQERL